MFGTCFNRATSLGRTFNAGASFLQLQLDDRAAQAAEVLRKAASQSHDARRGFLKKDMKKTENINQFYPILVVRNML